MTCFADYVVALYNDRIPLSDTHRITIFGFVSGLVQMKMAIMVLIVDNITIQVYLYT